jgi:hypothetical protein
MTTDLPKQTMLRRPGATARPGDTTMRSRAVPTSCVQAALAAANDQSSYEAAVSEGWPVSPHWQHERGAKPG